MKNRNQFKNQNNTKIDAKMIRIGCIRFIQSLPELISLCGRAGIAVSIGMPETSGCVTLHVMFDRYGKRLLAYWPATGTILRDGVSEKVAIRGPEDLLRLVSRMPVIADVHPDIPYAV